MTYIHQEQVTCFRYTDTFVGPELKIHASYVYGTEKYFFDILFKSQR